MVGVVVLVSGIILGVFALRMRLAGLLLNELNALRAAGDVVQSDFGQYLQQVNTRLRDGRPVERDPLSRPTETPTPPNLRPLLSIMYGKQHAALRHQVTAAAPIFSRLATVLIEQDSISDELHRSARDVQMNQAAFITAMIQLRGEIVRVQAHTDQAGGTDLTLLTSAPLQAILVEAQNLGMLAGNLDDAAPDAECTHAIGASVGPSLSRLTALAAQITGPSAGPVTTSVAGIVTAFRGNEAAGTLGILEGLSEARALARRDARIRSEASDLLTQALGIQESVRQLVAAQANTLRDELSLSFSEALRQSLVASGLGLLVLVVLARVLAANARRHVHQAFEAEAFVRSAVDSLESHTVVLGGDAEILSVNQAWREFASANGGTDREVFEGANYVAACDKAAAHCPEAAQVAAAVRAVLAGEAEPKPIEYPCHAPDEQRWFLCSIRGFSRGANRFAVVSHLNVTAAKKAEAELAATNAQLVESQQHLEARVVERTAELAQATLAAQAASKAKSEFLATMSHEIRTPLNGLVGTLELLQGSSLSEQQKRYIQIGKTSALSLTSVINDILDFSKVEAGKLELSPVEFDLHSAVGDVMEMLAVRASEKGLEMACSIEPTLPALVRGDVDRLRQIIINMVNNAIKFTERGAITLRVAGVGGGADHSTRIRFSIKDTGIGIPKDRLDRLFKAFSQTDASFSRKYGGTGLGLAICKQLAELMDGCVGVESEPGVGSTFWFEVELPAVADQSVPQSVTPTVDCRSLRLLVVEDHDAQREFIAECLASLHFAVDTAADGDAALAMLLEAEAAGRPFATVLTDQEMPGMDGIEVAAAMQSKAELASIPVILLSSALEVDPERVLAAGFASHLTKPIRQSSLLDAVMAAVAPRTGAITRTDSMSTGAPVDVSQSLEQAASRPRLRVLLAEDNEINQYIACELLAKHGFDCTVASNGIAAVAAVSKDRFDLVLMDCQMPEMDGFEATSEIRKREQAGALAVQNGRRLPIIALTANALKGDRERCLEAGMDAYSTKPIDLKQLTATIESLMSAPPPTRQAA